LGTAQCPRPPIIAYTAEPDSRAQEQHNFLDSWSAAQQREDERSPVDANIEMTAPI